MVNGATTQATDIINNQDDKDAVSMSLGNSGIDANVKSTADNESWETSTGKSEYDPQREAEYWEKELGEKYWEKDTTNYEQKEYEISQEIDKLQDYYESIDNIKTLDPLLDNLTDEELKAATGYNHKEFEKFILGYKSEKEFNKIMKTLKNGVKTKIGKQLEELRTTKDSYYDKWDRRTDQQKRDDTAYQRASDDLSKAGYNPNYLKGVSGGGGGGGLGSKADDEEEKRKKRKRELEAERQAQQQQRQDNMRMLMSVLGTMGGIGGTLGGAMIRNKGLMGMANIRGQSYLDSQELRNMNALDLEKLRFDNKVSHTQIKDMYQRSNNDRKAYQQLQRDKRKRYSYWDDIDW